MYDRYIIIANDSNNRLWAFGTPNGNRPFTTETAADRRKRQMERTCKGEFSFLVIPLRAEVPCSMRRMGQVAA